MPGISATLFLRATIKYAGTFCPTHYLGFLRSTTRGGGALISHADSGDTAPSTDIAGTPPSQDSTRQQTYVIEVETEEGGASDKVSAVRVVKSAKIRALDYSQPIPAYPMAGTVPEYPRLGFVLLLLYPYPYHGWVSCDSRYPTEIPGRLSTMPFRVTISTAPDPHVSDRDDILTHPYTTAACAAGVVTRTTDGDSSRYRCGGNRRSRQLALDCEGH